ncbi:MAG: arylsulfatase [bacterium]|nr:arylsulfatase [Gammaproteobacteria bacterium]HIL96212.1 arylsulfatase [Pseudomonadales bacterium]
MTSTQRLIVLVFILLVSPLSFSEQRPNILLIVADDLGYADLGVYGSDINTPNIDALADEGLLFTQFHTAATCAPSRAMLLSGNNNHVAGMASQFSNPDMTERVAGYEKHLSDRVGILPRILNASGYRTYMVGKWHLGYGEELSPAVYGFDRSFNLSGGAGNHYNEVGMRPARSSYYEDGKRTTFPAGGYSTAVYTDKLISYLEADKDSSKPFFIFAAYTSPHWPLQVPEDEIDRYQGQYDMGYDELREMRVKSLKAAEIIPISSQTPPRNTGVKPWSELSRDEKRIESKKMELYAAMVDNLDGHVGRLISYLKENELYENTLIVFMSDNGAASEQFFESGRFSEYLKANYDNSYEKMGLAASWVSYGPAWAEAGSAPFRRHKNFATEGGTTAPMIISGAGVKRRHEINSAFVSISDLAPTFYEIAGATYPDDMAEMTGKSIVPILTRQSGTVRSETDITVFFQSNHAGLWQGNWKLVNVQIPFDEKNFELFDLSKDPGETIDLSASLPVKRSELIALWRSERKRLGILLPEDL